MNTDTTETGSLGECYVSLSVSIGQSCTYPATTDAFSVNDRGRGSFLSFLAGIRIRIDNQTINGRVYDFEASHQGDGVWRIDRIAGSTDAPTTGGGDMVDGDDDNSQGAGQSAATTLRYYRSTDATISMADTEVGTGAVGALAAAGTSDESISLTAPLTAGTYYYGACVDRVSGESNTQNNCSNAVALTLSASHPDRDHAALVALYEATDGPNWVNNDNWLTNAPLGDWYGVDTDSAGRVVRLDLGGRLDSDARDYIPHGLSGPVPSELGNLANLTSLNLAHNFLGGPIPTELGHLANLTSLDLSYNAITDVSALSSLIKIQRLGLDINNITDISELSGLTNLTSLGLSYNNAITDLSPLAGLTNLTYLNLARNNITDISELSGLTNLTHLLLSYNAITDVSALSGLTKLSWLLLWGNNITDVSALSGLTNMRRLHLAQNNITDISALSGLTNLDRLDLERNNITAVSALSGMTDLRMLLLWGNNITDVSALSGLTNVSWLDLAQNNITDISALSGLTNLNRLDLRGNLLNDSSVSVHLPALQSRGVMVRYHVSVKGDFDIELVFLDDFTETHKSVLQYAVLRWMSVIKDDLPDYEFTQSRSGKCGDHSYEIPAGERIDDLRIYIGTFEGLGGATGYGSPSVLRNETHLPVLGCMAFDLSIANLLTTGLHEIGHVLGFGTLWDELGFYQDLDGDTHFNGPLAIAAFDEAGGSDYAGAKVPLEEVQSGRAAHWRPSVFPNELMGPYGGGALSAITVQSLADLGYGVDVTQADEYTLPGTTAAQASAMQAVSIPAIPGDDRLNGRLASPTQVEPELWCSLDAEREPVYVVDQLGRIIRTIGD